MRRIRCGIIGLGYIGQSYIETLRRLGFVDIVAVSDTNEDLARRCAEEMGISGWYSDYNELILDPKVEVVHNCTPNHLHKDINLKTITAGKHIFSEKPLGLDSTETSEMLMELSNQPHVLAGINFCYRMNALVQDAKNRIAAGEIGRPLLVHGSYLQDWLLFDTDYNWRVEPRYSGASRVVGDIGSHWMDLAQVMLNAKITSVCAHTSIVHPVRKKPSKPVETFSTAKDADYENITVETEDYAGVLLRFENGTVGSFSCSQVSAGRKCFIDIEIDGSISSFQWQHQTGETMWKGNRNANNEEIFRNPTLLTDAAKPFAMLAAGHPEGWNDAFKNNLTAFYDYIREGKTPGSDPVTFATFEDGHYLMLITEAILKSAQEERWIHIDDR